VSAGAARNRTLLDAVAGPDNGWAVAGLGDVDGGVDIAPMDVHPARHRQRADKKIFISAI